MQISQNKKTIVLLPGLNGTDALLQDFINSCPEQLNIVALSYPTQHIETYQELTEWVCQKLTSIEGPIVLIGESYSGPLSLFVANKTTSNVIAVVLVASFIYPPRPALLKYLPWQIGFSLTKPLYALRGQLTGDSDTINLIKAASSELQRIHPSVLANRVRETLLVDASKELAACRYPILHLQATKDIVAPKSALRKILDINRSVKVEKFQTQHFLLQSAPREAWRAIALFLDSL